MAYNNLPATFESRLDQNLVISETSNDPKVLVIGTAGQGVSETFYPVRRLSEAKKTFGTSGTLIRGMYEANGGGATNLRLFRIGATAAKLDDVGGGILIETIAGDDSTGTDYTLFWEHSTGRLRVWRVSDDTLVYDNSPSYPLSAVDLGEVQVTGAKAGTGTWTDIGTLPTPITLAAADGQGGDTGAEYTAGTDGLTLSRMETYEALYKAYKLLEDQAFDVVIPMNVFLDDANCMDMIAADSEAAQPLSNAYPTLGTTGDILGKVYVEEYEGEFCFHWWIPSDPKADVDATFTADGGAQIFSTAGSGTATVSPSGTPLTGSSFHEVNFAHQLADFCYTQSSNVIDVTGVIGVLPPASYGPKDVSNWIGKIPVAALNETTGNTVISTNGSGLLGNKFMMGRLGTAGRGGLPAFTVNNTDGLFGGGFIGTDDGFVDGTQLTDDNDALVDIGQYISVVAAYPTLSNSSRTSAYVSTGAATYGGFYSKLPANSSPANKLIDGIRLPFRISISKLDILAGAKYVTFHSKPKGYVISDAPTAARAESDYRRLTTVRIVKAVVDDIRSASDAFLGEPMSALQLAALETRVDEVLAKKVKEQYLNRYDKRLSATPSQKVLGQAVLELTLVPAFELRQIYVVVSLAAL